MKEVGKYAVAIIITAIVSIGATYAALTFTPLAPTTEELKLKAGFIYVGPVGDYGWTYAHDRGRRIVDEKYDWLTTTYAESIGEGDVGGQIDTMFEQDIDIVFTTSYGYMVDTVQRGDDWPDKMLYHCSGGSLPYEESAGEEFTADNVGFYFADFYQIYYLNGLLAGALAESDKIGYVAAVTTPEVVRHLNSFFLGAKEVNPDVQMQVKVTGDWYAPTESRTATESLISWGADAIAFTQDSTAVVQACQSHFDEDGERVYSFSHYTPMKSKGPNVTLSGQLIHWENLYDDLLLKARSGVIENTQHWRLLESGAVEVGSDWDEPINPKFTDEVSSTYVTDPVFGNITVYDLFMKRLGQFKELRETYHPFTGPLYDSNDQLQLKEGEVISQDDLRWRMLWYVKGIIPPA